MAPGYQLSTIGYALAFNIEALEAQFFPDHMLRLHGRPAETARHAKEIRAFSPDFLPTILNGDLVPYKMPEHSNLLLEGLHYAGLPENGIH